MHSERTTPVLRERAEFVAVAAAPAAARDFVRRTLRGCGLAASADTAELITSELVTNAVRATGPGKDRCPADVPRPPAVIGVELRTDGRSLGIAVEDGSDEHPAYRSADDGAESGRGLHLVAALSCGWVVEALERGGKAVRCSVPVPDPAVTGRPARPPR
jgi:anti-sigma regulatory factor (Ser/Thr protein kinase)